MSSCDECGQSFASERGLSVHKFRAHRENNAEDYSCEHCDYKSNIKRLLQRHKFKHHLENDYDSEDADNDGINEVFPDQEMLSEEALHDLPHPELEDMLEMRIFR